MTAVACGAALYGSTISVPEQLLDERRDKSKIQIEISVKSTSVEEFEYAAIKFLKDKSENFTEEAVFVDFVRTDGEYNSGRIRIDSVGDAVELKLKTDTTNVFEIRCYDSMGNKLDCEPQTLSIIQGIDGIGDAVLPLHIGLATVDNDDDVIFTPLEGLRKNLPLPAYGKNGNIKMVTDREIRPGMTSDKVVFPILQTDQDIDQLNQEHKKLKRIYCDHQYDCYFTGDDIPAMLPAGSEINITVHADKSGTLDSFIVDIPYLNMDIDVTDRITVTKSKEADASLYLADIEEARKKLQTLDNSSLNQQLEEASDNFKAAENKDRDQKEQALDALKEILSKIDTEYSLGDWERMESKLLGMYRELSQDNQKYGNDKTTAIVRNLKQDVDRVIAAKDIDAAEKLYDQIWQMDYKLAEVEFYIAWISQWNRNFNQKRWSNPTRARSLVNQGMELINKGNPKTEELRPIAFELSDMLPRSEKPQNEGLLRQKK
jgi:molecular chaperone DnaK